MKRITYGIVVLTVNGTLIAGCKTALPSGQSLTNESISQRDTATTNKQMSQLVKTFSEDQGPLGQEALRKLQAYPQTELIGTLVELQRTVAPSDKLRPQIAFVFCWLERDYESNVKLIESALSKTSRYQGFYADDAQMMLSRLTQRGKKDLLKPLFESVSWADGALAEGLAETFARESKSDPEQFLSQLVPSPTNTREKVYWLIQSSDSFTDSELSDLRRRLSSIPKTSAVYEPAKELLRTLSSKASK
jgi:hypothetical protein